MGGEQELQISQKTEANSHPKRGNWDNQCDFFLSCLGYAVGLGNVWRFPYLCYKHGGGSFLVAYSLMLAGTGLPLFFLELAMGQYAGIGPVKLFGRMAPAFAGIGAGMVFLTFLVVIYYNMVIAWALYYTFAGFTSQLPWEFCGHAYNTIACYHRGMAGQCDAAGNGLASYWNNTCAQVKDICDHYGFGISEGVLDSFNVTKCSNGTHDLALEQVYTRKSASEEYYNHVVLGLDDDSSWSNFGDIQWHLVLCLFVAWLIVGLCLVKGIQSSGKIVYFTATFPYFVLVVLLIKGATLEGAGKGIEYYLTPKFERLMEVQVWSDAATQIFYSLGLSFGALITLSSYNQFDTNCHRNAIIIGIINCTTSVFAGFVIFAIIGFMAHELGEEVEDVIASGPGLAFIAYPEAVTKMPLAPLWSFLFFMMLITLGLDTQLTLVETITTAFMDHWPNLRQKKAQVAFTVSLIGFILGLSQCFQGGVFMFTLIDWFSASWSLLVVALIEIIFLAYVYGQENLFSNVAEMGMVLPAWGKFYWRVMWQFVTPVILAVILAVTVINFSPCHYGKYVFPPWAQALGLLMSCSAVLAMVGMSLLEYYTRKRLGKSVGLADMIRPVEEEWGPPADKDTVGYGTYSNRGFDKE